MRTHITLTRHTFTDIVATGNDSPLTLGATTVIEILDLRGDRMMTMLGELIFKVTGNVDVTVETMPRQGTIAKV